MKRLFEIVTDHIGESYVRSYAWADNAADAERLFRESFPAIEVMRVNPLFWQHAGTFVTTPSDSGWETSQELAAILALQPNERDVPDDEETRKLRFAISDCEAYCRGVSRDISRDVVEVVAKALRECLAADRAERDERARHVLEVRCDGKGYDWLRDGEMVQARIGFNDPAVPALMLLGVERKGGE